jgi:hypothetical protein
MGRHLCLFASLLRIEDVARIKLHTLIQLPETHLGAGLITPVQAAERIQNKLVAGFADAEPALLAAMGAHYIGLPRRQVEIRRSVIVNADRLCLSISLEPLDVPVPRKCRCPRPQFCFDRRREVVEVDHALPGDHGLELLKLLNGQRLRKLGGRLNGRLDENRTGRRAQNKNGNRGVNRDGNRGDGGN